MNDIPISYPGRYAPGVALNFADATGSARQVSESSPLPVVMAVSTSGSAQPAALTGTASSASTAGPFVPVAGKPLILTLSGTWAGKVTLLRSINSGATRLPLSLAGAPWGVFSANVNEPVWDETETSAIFYLQLAPTSGTVAYRLTQ
jgi:hypothetical protein